MDKLRKARKRVMREYNGITLNPAQPLRKWRLIWGPTGQTIATVEARTMRAARRKAPAPYCKYLGEIAVEEVLDG